MKNRQGFVSNSSSSSFIIKKDKGIKITKEDIFKALGISKDSPISYVGDDIYEIVENCLDSYNKLDIETLANNSCIRKEDFENNEDYLLTLADDSFLSIEDIIGIDNGDPIEIYENSISDECCYDNPFEMFICRYGLELKGKGFEITCDEY